MSKIVVRYFCASCVVGIFDLSHFGNYTCTILFCVRCPIVICVELSKKSSCLLMNFVFHSERKGHGN